jgi:hypothetical protein
MTFGAGYPVQQVTIIGQQQGARRLLVQPPDGRDRRIAPSPPFRQQAADKGADFPVRSGNAQGLVHQDHQTRDGIQRLAANLHPGRQVRRDGNAPGDVAPALARRANLLREP